MAQSRKDKDRKDKVEKYKSKQKSEKMAQVPESKPFQQVPTWDSNETFELQGHEFEALFNFFNIFTAGFQSIQQVFARGVQSGKIKIGYQYEDGTPVADEEVKSYTQKLNEYFKQRQAEETAKAATADATESQAGIPKAKILSFTGEPVSSEETV